MNKTDDIPYATDEVPTQGLFNDWLDAIDGVIIKSLGSCSIYLSLVMEKFPDNPELL